MSTASSQAETIHCWIYRCSKKDEMYLYLAAKDDFSCLPDNIRSMLGELHLSMHLDLHSERKLARVNVIDVMADLKERGFHIQLPPNRDGRWDA
jgi:hypothetical protein